MDDDLESLETELQALVPRRPSPGLLARLDHELAEPPASRQMPSVHWLWAAILPAAAAVAVMLHAAGRWGRSADEASAGAGAVSAAAAPGLGGASLKPVAFEKVLLTAEDEGLVTLADGTAARRERRNYLDTVTWRNPRTNASLTWTVPREEVRVIPISFQ